MTHIQAMPIRSESLQDTAEIRAAHPLGGKFGNPPASDSSMSSYRGMKSGKGVSWLSRAKQKRAGCVRAISWSI